jgi:hypothetical protein
MALTDPRRGVNLAKPSPRRRSSAARGQRASLCEILDRVLNKGVVLAGDVIISIADVDLLYLGLNAVITSVETMQHWDSRGPIAAQPEGK